MAKDPATKALHDKMLNAEGELRVNENVHVAAISSRAEQAKTLADFDWLWQRGQYELINGIHHYILIAMVESSGEKNSSYAIVDLHENDSLFVTGCRRAVSTALEV